MARLRVAGFGRGEDGEHVTWSVAEGSRGRRWREVVVRGGRIEHSLLLELDPAGRFAHLELSTPAGLLTLHPEGDGTLHGNAVTVDGVHHVQGVVWPADGVVLVAGSPVCAAIAATRDVTAAGEVAALRIGPDLALVRDAPLPGDLAADPHGLPRLRDARTWPLELEPEG